MIRDFSDASLEDLKGKIHEIDAEQWFAWTDWLGDFFMGGLDVTQYTNRMQQYHKKVLDKNNTTVQQVEQIFENVHEVDRVYAEKLNASLARVDEQLDYIQRLTDAVVAGQSIHSAGFTTALRNAGLYEAKDKMLQNQTAHYRSMMLTEGGYDFELIRRLMEGDANKLPLAMYYALEAAFCAMDIEDKERFLSMSYIELERTQTSANGNTKQYTSVMQLSDVFRTMSLLNAEWLVDREFSREELIDKTNPVHGQLFNTLLLQQMQLQAGTVRVSYLDTNGKAQPNVGVSLNQLTLNTGAHIYDYEVKIRTGTKETGGHDFRMYQYRSNIGVVMDYDVGHYIQGQLDALEDYATGEVWSKIDGMYSSTVIDILTSLIPGGRAAKIASVASTLALDGVSAAGSISKAQAQIPMYNNLADMNRLDKIYDALYFGGTMTVSSNYGHTIHVDAVDAYQLNVAMRLYCQENEGKLEYDWSEYSAEMAIEDFCRSTPRNPELEHYIDWYIDHDDMERSLRAYDRQLENAMLSHPIGGKSKTEELTYDEIVWLEQHFVEERNYES